MHEIQSLYETLLKYHAMGLIVRHDIEALIQKIEDTGKVKLTEDRILARILPMFPNATLAVDEAGDYVINTGLLA